MVEWILDGLEAYLTGQSKVLYYADDVIISTNESILHFPFIAPGRRKLFADQFSEYPFLLKQNPRCIPPTGPEDFGLSQPEMQAMVKMGIIEIFRSMVEGENVPWKKLKELDSESQQFFRSVALWAEGCKVLEAGQGEGALEKFKMALDILPEAKILKISMILGLLTLEKWDELNGWVSRVNDEFQGDPRFSVVLAYIGISKGNFGEAEELLRIPAEQILRSGGKETVRRLFAGEINRELLEFLKNDFPDHCREYVENTLVAEEYYYVLLWNSRFDGAKEYALNMAERLTVLDLPISKRLDRAGDASFNLKDYPGALSLYENSLREKD